MSELAFGIQSLCPACPEPAQLGHFAAQGTLVHLAVVKLFIYWHAAQHRWMLWNSPRCHDHAPSWDMAMSLA